MSYAILNNYNELKPKPKNIASRPGSICSLNGGGIVFLLKGIRIQSQFLNFMENSILYAKITLSQKKWFQNFHVPTMSQILTNVQCDH